MNPITNMKNLNKMNDRELEMGLSGTKNSWHNQYSDSAWVFVGGLPYDLSEGDVICVFSQYGEIVHINLVRDLQSGKSKGFAFICYEDQRSTILAVDNLNGAKVLGRLLRVDHVQTYKLPKNLEKLDEERKKLLLEGCAPKPIVEELDNAEESVESENEAKAAKKAKKKKKKKEKKKRQSSSSDSSSEEEVKRSEIRKEERKEDPRRSNKPEDDRVKSGRSKETHFERGRSRERPDEQKTSSRSKDYTRRERSRSQERRKEIRDRSRDKGYQRNNREEGHTRRYHRSRSRDRR